MAAESPQGGTTEDLQRTARPAGTGFCKTTRVALVYEEIQSNKRRARPKITHHEQRKASPGTAQVRAILYGAERDSGGAG